MFRRKQPEAFGQCGYGSIAVLFTDRIQQTVPLRPQCRQADLGEKRVHAFNMRIQRCCLDIQLFRQSAHGKRRKTVLFDQFFCRVNNNFLVQSLMKHTVAPNPNGVRFIIT